MKIATWNLQRLKKRGKLQEILEKLREVNADILVLTETDPLIHPGSEYASYTSYPLRPTNEDICCRDGENRTTIWSKFPISSAATTFNFSTSICANVQTPHGDLKVYGTVIGIHGNRRPSFLLDLEEQICDWKTLSDARNICIAGDFNISFSDNSYFTKEGRTKISRCFTELEIDNLTDISEILENVDHIAISNSYWKAAQCKTDQWNRDKSLSDHIGVSVTLEFDDSTKALK